ncbi:MAG: serine protease [Alicyclobacillus macrosporangiidus]|uniref:S1 family peptidase n=1 Tax=Alicyclobacillus macrosporangiidus TaxID=392015 RepID=UPI0026E93C58|nr:serine protease [Alicyclobacillus macrosporangiidus]MCL6600070.1 serine protease [Alicyclobacillus macrosporangiidus]
MALSMIDQLMYTTVKITALDSRGIPVSTGTGFFFKFDKGNGIIQPIIVTNKHVLIKYDPQTRTVVEEYDKILIHFNLADAQNNPIAGRYYSYTAMGIKQGRIDHPQGDIDLCCVPIAPLIRDMQSRGLQPFYVNIDKSVIPDEKTWSELNAMEDIVMIGYPNGLWDHVNNLPIMRRGVTATHPKFDYNGEPKFVIDCACFPGSSGSPVFIFNQGSYHKNGAIVVDSRLLFVGILYAGPQHTATGEIQVVDVPTAIQPVVFSLIPNNLGYVIKSTKVLDFEPLLDERNKQYQ